MTPSGRRPGTNGHVIMRPVSAVRCSRLDRTATYSSWLVSLRGAISPGRLIISRRPGSPAPPCAGVSPMTNLTTEAYADMPLFLLHLLEYMDAHLLS